MKPLLLFVLLWVNSINAQILLLDVLPLIDAKVTYKKVHEVLGNSKTDLVSKAGNWYTYQSIALEVDKPLDETHQYLSGTYAFKTLWGPNDYIELYKEVQCKINLTLKNERYQYEISSFLIKEPNRATQLEVFKMDDKKLSKYNQDFYKRIDKKINELISGLEEAMSN